jgi:3-dehydro-L-gulonate-6-phosphate decarboxylase
MSRPRLQVALDTFDLPSAVGPLQKAGPFAEIIEVGTILCLAEGMAAVRLIRAMYPSTPVLADVRIAEAGSIIARQCFDAGATLVSCVAGASLTTIGQVVEVARSHGGQVQVELGEDYSVQRAVAWRDLGVQHVIVKRSRDKEAAGELSWAPQDLDRVRELAGLGLTVTVTGGITVAGLDVFAGAPVGVVIVGRTIVQAEEPGRAAREFRAALERVWP